MLRARLASLALAGCLLLVAGCCDHCYRDPCDTGGGCFAGNGGGWFSRFRLASRNNGPDCCNENGIVANGGVPNGIVHPGEGPALIPPDAIITSPMNGTRGIPPRIVPVPQANPMPYTP